MGRTHRQRVQGIILAKVYRVGYSPSIFRALVSAYTRMHDHTLTWMLGR